LRAEGTAVVYVSHRFEELFRISDRVTILRDGSSVETRLMAETTGKDLIDRMVGRPLDTVFPRHEAHTAGEMALDVRNVRCENLGVRNVSLTVRKGEVLGLAGLVGSGRTQFAEALFGLEPIDEGEVFVYGRKSTIKSPEDAVRSGLAYVPEDRRRHGVILGMSVATNTTLASLQQVSRHGFLSWRREEANAQTFVERLGVKTASTDAPARTLSGGNQQKVALARWLMTNPKILILDEPTQGIDVGAKAEIYKLIVDLARHGLAILMISSETPELLALCDRIAVMAKGELAGILEREEATQHAVLDLALGHAKTSGGQTT
jgi:rhamnose transport system ATP-binding protein